MSTGVPPAVPVCIFTVIVVDNATPNSTCLLLILPLVQGLILNTNTKFVMACGKFS